MARDLLGSEDEQISIIGDVLRVLLIIAAVGLLVSRFWHMARSGLCLPSTGTSFTACSVTFRNDVYERQQPFFQNCGRFSHIVRIELSRMLPTGGF